MLSLFLVINFYVKNNVKILIFYLKILNFLGQNLVALIISLKSSVGAEVGLLLHQKNISK